MVLNEELESELTELRTNADNLSHCLHALLERIEQLEGLTGQELLSMKNNAKTGISEPTSDVQVVKSETIAVDPLTGLKKKTIVTERILTTKTFHAVSKLPSSIGSPELLEFEHVNATLVNGHLPLLGRAYEARLVDVRGDQLKQIEVEEICGEMVVTKVHPNVAGIINPGDTLLEINGKPMKTKKDLFTQVGTVQAKVVIADVYNAPTEFVKALANYDSEKDQTQPSNLPIRVRRGEIFQVLSSDKKNGWIQARKVNDLSKCAFLPSSLPTVKVSMMCPYGRRTLVLLGAPGVGRRTLKSMLLAQLPNQFSTVVPVTSRAPKNVEQEGREYHYETKQSILKLIRENQMIEWGELAETLYGTSAESVRKVMRTGRVCVLDCAAKALDYLYNREFMPFVVVIGPPSFEELQQMANLREGNQKTEDELKKTVEYHSQLLKSEYAKCFDMVLINRNHDITFRRLLEALENLKNSSQWVPLEWLS